MTVEKRHSKERSAEHSEVIEHSYCDSSRTATNTAKKPND
jgi:hypothetical protein